MFNKKKVFLFIVIIGTIGILSIKLFHSQYEETKVEELYTKAISNELKKLLNLSYDDSVDRIEIHEREIKIFLNKNQIENSEKEFFLHVIEKSIQNFENYQIDIIGKDGNYK